MYLLLNDRDDPLCNAVLASLQKKGCDARVIGNPVLRPIGFAWRFDTCTSTSRLTWEDGTNLSDREIEGVLVRTPGRIAGGDWNPADPGYMQTETEAALLAWLWSLDCPVINRYPAALWYRSNTPLLFWLSELERHGLRGFPSLISNVEQEGRAFGATLGDRIAYAPLTAATRYPLVSDDLWRSVVAMQRLGPVHLTQASLVPCSACVVGSRVVWGGRAPADAGTLESAFAHLAAAAGLAFVEVTSTSDAEGIYVAAINPHPSFEHFDRTAQTEIVSELVELLTKEPAGHRPLFWMEE